MQAQVAFFGDPVYMRIGANETLGELKPRIQVSVFPIQDCAECLGA